jgi:hypothetical protein
MRKVIISVAVLALLLAGTVWLVQQNAAKGELVPRDEIAARTYSNAVYGYRFDYPGDLALVEFLPEIQAIEDQSRSEPNELVQIAVEEADLDAAYNSFRAFAEARARIYCAADGLQSSLECTETTRTDSFTTGTGVKGDVFYLKIVSVRGAERSEAEAGPFYVFNMSTDAPGSGYRALIFRPATFFGESEMYDLSTQAATAVVNTLRID